MGRRAKHSSFLFETSRSGNEGLMKTSLGTAIEIIAVSLTAWVFFYLTSGPLRASETTVVVGFSALLVIFVKWLWTQIRKPKKEKRA